MKPTIIHDVRIGQYWRQDRATAIVTDITSGGIFSSTPVVWYTMRCDNGWTMTPVMPVLSFQREGELMGRYDGWQVDDAVADILSKCGV